MLILTQPSSYYRLFIILTLAWFALVPVTTRADKVVVVPLIDERLPAIKPQAAVELTRFLNNDNTSTGLPRIMPDGSSPGNYTVPDGKVFVITAAHITPQTADTSPTFIRLLQNNIHRQTWRVPTNEMTQVNFAPGLQMSAGSSVNAINFNFNSGSVRLSVYGYEVDVRQ